MLSLLALAAVDHAPELCSSYDNLVYYSEDQVGLEAWSNITILAFVSAVSTFSGSSPAHIGTTFTRTCRTP